jgi:hypothetical protein
VAAAKIHALTRNRRSSGSCTRGGVPHLACWLRMALTLGLAGSCGGGAADFVSLPSPVFALTHVRVIDGTGRPGVDDQTVLVDHGRIVAVGPSTGMTVPAAAAIVDLPGRTVFPGLVGMHEHLFYQLAPPGSRTTYAVQSPFRGQPSTSPARTSTRWAARRIPRRSRRS